MVKRKAKEGPLVAFYVDRVPEAQKRAFQKLCIDKGQTLRERVLQLIEKDIRANNRKGGK